MLCIYFVDASYILLRNSKFDEYVKYIIPSSVPEINLEQLFIKIQ